MKKLVCYGLSALLGAVMFGCSSSSGGPDGDKVELTFWRRQNEPWAASYQKIAREFEEKNPDVRVNIEFFPYDQFESRVQTSLISKEGGADIYELWGGWGLDFASTGALTEIPEGLSETIHDDVYPSTIGTLEYEGKLHSLPTELNIENGAMLVNKRLMSEHNLKTPTTWEELREAAKKATEKGGDTITIKGFDFMDWDSVPHMFLSVILSTGGTYQDEGDSFSLQTPQAEAALQELYDIVKVDGVTTIEGLDGGDDMERYQQLYAGNVVMVPHGPWTITEGITSFGLKYGKGFDYVSMPWFGDKPTFAVETGWSMAVNGNSRQQGAVFKFPEYFFQDNVLMRRDIACSQIPPKKSVVPSPESIEQIPCAKPLVKILDKSQFIGHFNTDQLKGKANATFQKPVRGDTKSIDQALITMEEELNGIIKK